MAEKGSTAGKRRRATVTARWARVRVGPSLRSACVGSLAQGTEVSVTTEQKHVRRGDDVVARTRVVKPCSGWVSLATLSVSSPETAAIPDECASWRKRATQVILRQHNRALTAIRRQRNAKAKAIEKDRHELQRLDKEEARLSRLIVECLEQQTLDLSRPFASRRTDDSRADLAPLHRSQSLTSIHSPYSTARRRSSLGDSIYDEAALLYAATRRRRGSA